MKRSKKLIIAILLVILLGLIAFIAGTLFMTPDLSHESKNILVLASDKYEQSNGGVDMAFMVHLENGSLKNYTPIYPGGMSHPTKSAPGDLQGAMMLHDCLWNGLSEGMQNAKEIVEARTGMHADAVIVVYDESMDNIINSISPLEVNGVTYDNLTATSIIRQNDAYNGYAGNDNVQGNMSRADAVMVLAKALANAAKDPVKKSTMVQTALKEYSNGNIVMEPQGSFTKLLATKGFESIA
ncbi:DUF4012 domain-containing protein [uncultured Methanobrevibacter sp.]|uniref:DUF4012 domain-containing protein n=1 Tax=uncultured Methanobrevibacter sp. TaxID=253161 RepID=UPI0025F0FB2A|nr:DUF4012 domain-containing protein [uncultured Methanobrevibacter sp.]MCI6994119.1 DUF4012 domain-containing protein [Methanobrevibacter sp.]